MMSAVVLLKRPSCIYWSKVEKWTPTSSFLQFGKLPYGWRLLPVYEFATQIDSKERVEPDAEYRMAGVRWYGEGIFHRETVLGKEQSANYLYPLKPGVIIYNRLFAWKESFAVVPEGFVGLYVSNEFPQFEIIKAIALPLYVYLLFTSKKIIKAVNPASIGSAAISRNRYKESVFLDFKVPIPPLSVQQKIVAYWESAQKQRASADRRLPI
jgi:type I restriction enzyme, S subunit